MKAHWEMEVKVVHIPGDQNVRAFHRHLQHARVLTEVPTEMMELLVTVQPDWMSPAWSRRFTSCLRQDWPLQREERTGQEQRSQLVTLQTAGYPEEVHLAGITIEGPQLQQEDFSPPDL